MGRAGRAVEVRDKENCPTKGGTGGGPVHGGSRDQPLKFPLDLAGIVAKYNYHQPCGSGNDPDNRVLSCD